VWRDGWPGRGGEWAPVMPPALMWRGRVGGGRRPRMSTVHLGGGLRQAVGSVACGAGTGARRELCPQAPPVLQPRRALATQPVRPPPAKWLPGIARSAAPPSETATWHSVQLPSPPRIGCLALLAAPPYARAVAGDKVNRQAKRSEYIRIYIGAWNA